MRHYLIRFFSLSLLFATACSFAHPPVYQQPANYKGERDYKYEAPREPLPCINEAVLKDGFYIGLGAGYDAYKIRQNLLADGLDIFTANPALSAKGFNGTVFAGYGQYYDWFYFGAEILGTASSAKTSSTVAAEGASLTQRLHVRQSYGVGILPGFNVNDYALIYARLGYLRTSLKASENVALVGIGSVGDSVTKWLNGFNYGVGIETAIFQNTSIRGEYTYTSYGFFHSESGVSKFSPSDNDFTLALIYHFC